jgi:hypothetical protein
MQIVKVNKHQESQVIDWLQVGVGGGWKVVAYSYYYWVVHMVL